ncbi:MAG: XRE family transcriptional regulator [Hyphomicrobiales bacterium]|nr:MAG: XRE family transcriptional regulator [Hyphomicrobiales bacterium]
MQVIDPKKIAKLMVIQGVSQRSLAKHAGFKSHAYMGRILKGEIKTIDPDRAVRIAALFGVGMDDLFVPRVSNDAARSVDRQAS